MKGYGVILLPLPHPSLQEGYLSDTCMIQHERQENCRYTPLQHYLEKVSRDAGGVLELCR